MNTQANLLVGTDAPFSQEAEEAVIGAVLVSPNALLGIASFLRPEDFYFLRHAHIWNALLALNARSDQIDLVTLANELQAAGRLDEIGGQAYLMQLAFNVPTSMHAEVYGRIVERAAIRRRLLVAVDEIRRLALDEQLAIETVTAEAEAKLFGVTDAQTRRQIVPMYEAISDYYDRVELLLSGQQGALGLPSGFRELDKLLGGLQRSDLLIFAGRPGMGKCVTGDTLIHTERGLIPIAELKPEGVVGTPDDEGGIFYPFKIGVQTPHGLQSTSHFYDSGLRPTLALSVVSTLGAQFTIVGTLNHPIRVHRDGRDLWVMLSEVDAHDRVYLHDQRGDVRFGMPVALQDAGIQHCYDLTVPEGHSFVANGFVCHNTSWMLSLALNAARAGGRILIFTMEMGVEQITQRFLSMETGINMQKLRLGQLEPHEFSRFTEAMGRLSQLPIFIDDTPALNPIQMRTKTRRIAHEFGVDLVIVDYLQLMNGGKMYEANRVQEISYISRALKELARELNVPLLSAAQLSRAVEQRHDKRPVLSDLRESGCIAGDEQVYLPETGEYLSMRDLVGKSGFAVLTLNTETWKLETGIVSRAISTGIAPVFKLTTQLGRTIRATANHKFLTIEGWKRLDELKPSDHMALPRLLLGPSQQTMTEAELGLLGHLIGDGCTLPRHAIQYTTREIDLAETVVTLAKEVFGEQINPRIHQEKEHELYQVFLSSSEHLTRGKQNPVAKWLRDLGVFGLRSYDKYVPKKVFTQTQEAIAVFLRHLWATDGCIRLRHGKRTYPAIYYATSSALLAQNVQSLLLRLEINARLKPVLQGAKGRTQYHVIVSGQEDTLRFANTVNTVGNYKKQSLAEVVDCLAGLTINPNRDVIPNAVWSSYALPSMKLNRISTRKMYADLDTAYAGNALYKQNLSRTRAQRLATAVKSPQIAALATSDVYWDKIAAIEPDGVEEVFDLTVPGNHNFVVNSVIVHNSIEQDADVVMFLYRDVVYNEATEFPNQANVIVAKHRNGPTGQIDLYFDKSVTRFVDADSRTIDLREL